MTQGEPSNRPSLLPRLIMSSSALALGASGLVASFAPDAVVSGLGGVRAPLLEALVQVLGAAHLGLAMLSWMSRHNVIGGIFGRPLVICHLTHALSGGLALGRALANASLPVPPWAWCVVAVYAALAVGFGALMIRHPARPHA